MLKSKTISLATFTSTENSIKRQINTDKDQRKEGCQFAKWPFPLPSYTCQKSLLVPIIIEVVTQV